MSYFNRQWLKGWIPPRLLSLYRWLHRGNALNGDIHFKGNYSTWEEAQRGACGWEESAIFTRVRDSAQRVRTGEAAFERDGIAFDSLDIRLSLLAGLLRAAAFQSGRLRVLDFGGSLGSTYFQCRHFLSGLSDFCWCVVEQPHYVAYGRKEFQNSELRFYNDVDSCLREMMPQVLLISGALQYLEDPYGMLEKLIGAGFSHIVLDRLPLLDVDDQLTVQYVPASIYGKSVSYPAWFFNRSKFLGMLQKSYVVIMEFDALDGTAALDDCQAFFKGFILEQRRL